MREPVELNDIDVAVSYLLDSKRRGMLPHGAPYSSEGFIAVTARSLADYACAANLIVADRRRQGAARTRQESERRHPSGRRVHTRAEALEMSDEAARRVTDAEEAELAAIAAAGVENLEAAQRGVAYIIEREIAGDDWQVVNDLAEAATKRVNAITTSHLRGFYVRGRASQARQPRGGIVPLSLFDLHKLGGEPLSRTSETGSPGTIASAVELLVRWQLGGDERARRGAHEAALESIRGVRRGEQTTGLGQIASRFRSGDADVFDELDWEEDVDDTLDHIAIMAKRVEMVFEQFGKPTSAGTVETTSDLYRLRGHIDFLDDTTLWDLKVSERRPTSADVLQLMLYCLVVRDDPALQNSPTHLGLINPRLGSVWRVEVASLPPDALTAIEAIALDHPGEFPG